VRKSNRGTRNNFTILWAAIALVVGLIGLGYHRHQSDAHARGRAGVPSEKAESSSSPGTQQSRPTGVRNG
jgi:hypothetical protein